MPFKRALFAFALLVPFVIATAQIRLIDAAESTTGVIVGQVLDSADKPIVRARIAAASPSGSAQTLSDTNGRFTIGGMTHLSSLRSKWPGRAAV